MCESVNDLVLLDFDDVVNVTRREPMWSAHSRWEFTELMGFPIRWSPDVVDCVNAVADRPNVTVKWLTSWEADSALFTELGFHDFGYLSPIDHLDDEDIREGRWKVAAGLAAADAFDGAVTWIDDDPMINHAVAASGRSNITRIMPSPACGISRKQLRLLADLTEP